MLIVHYAMVKFETDPTLKTKLVKSVINIAPFGILEATQNHNFRKRGKGDTPSHPSPKPSDKMSPSDGRLNFYTCVLKNLVETQKN